MLQAPSKQAEWAAYRHTTDTSNAGATTMQSVIEHNDLGELMNMVRRTAVPFPPVCQCSSEHASTLLMQVHPSTRRTPRAG